ncbi:MAG: hypothetical protein COA52_18065 [Hyphomicrobiales bacterium]|nr:twin transmembrane helix small protein [Hyphomicrobiales bacterium]PCJ84013.1 MAG: hypothetical protein COA52_18065 [Hyphomicrobiales bacterium]
MILLSKGIIAIALVAVVVVLFIGLFNMMRGGSANLSQKMMRWRVVLQFIAVIVMMSVLYLTGN